MKKLLYVFMLMLLTGCATTSSIKMTPEINLEKTAGIGDIFFIYEEITSVDPVAILLLPPGSPSSSNNIRFDLTILELNDQKIGLQYSEYFYRSGWMIKEGFNKRFDFVIADSIVRFKGYEFEILSIEKGQIKYKRIK